MCVCVYAVIQNTALLLTRIHQLTDSINYTLPLRLPGRFLPLRRFICLRRARTWSFTQFSERFGVRTRRAPGLNGRPARRGLLRSCRCVAGCRKMAEPDSQRNICCPSGRVNHRLSSSLPLAHIYTPQCSGKKLRRFTFLVMLRNNSQRHLVTLFVVCKKHEYP